MTRKRDLEKRIAYLERGLKNETQSRIDLLSEQYRRDRTLATLYPEHAGEWGEIDWDTLHATAEAVRRARQAKADAKTLKKWEGN